MPGGNARDDTPTHRIGGGSTRREMVDTDIIGTVSVIANPTAGQDARPNGLTMMNQSIKQIQKALTDRGLIEEIDAILEGCNQAFEAAYAGELSHIAERFKDNWQASWDWGFDNIDGLLELACFAPLVERLPSPQIITPGELVEAFLPYLAQEGDRILVMERFDEIYKCFVDHVVNRILSVRTRSLQPTCKLLFAGRNARSQDWLNGYQAGLKKVRSSDWEGDGEPPSPPNLWDDCDYYEYANVLNEADRLLWSGNGLVCRWQTPLETTLKVRDLHTGESEPTERTNLVPEINGRISGRALEWFSVRVDRLLRSLTVCFSQAKGSPNAPGFSQHRRNIPLVDSGVIRELSAFLRGCLGSVLSEPSKKDSVDRRLSNAAQLIVEADRQFSDAIALALCVAALDALFGEKGQEITTRISQCVAALLEPESKCRGYAEKYVRKLYDFRSRVLHGDSAAAEQQSKVEGARVVASASLYAYWFRKDCRNRSGEAPEKPAELLENLRSHIYQEGLPPGVLEIETVRRLWRTG